MQITMPPISYKGNVKDRDFLIKLDQRVHRTKNIRSRFGSGVIDEYIKDKNINQEELERALSLVNPQTGIAMTPGTTTFGFSTIYRFIYTFNKRDLLKVSEAQIPKEYDFNRLSQNFNHPSNIEMLISIELPAPKSKTHYEY